MKWHQQTYSCLYRAPLRPLSMQKDQVKKILHLPPKLILWLVAHFTALKNWIKQCFSNRVKPL